jgi:hypothetical protein
VPYCPYSSRIGLLLAEGGVDWELVRIDYVKGAREWYKRAYAPADAPAMQGTPGGDRDDLDAWVGGSAVCKANAILADGDVARRAVVKSKTSEDAVAKMAEPLIFGGLAPRMLGTREPRGRKILAFMLKKTLGEEEVKTMALTDDDGAKPDVNADDVREACRTAVRKAISRCVTVLVACEARVPRPRLGPGPVRLHPRRGCSHGEVAARVWSRGRLPWRAERVLRVLKWEGHREVSAAVVRQAVVDEDVRTEREHRVRGDRPELRGEDQRRRGRRVSAREVARRV